MNEETPEEILSIPITRKEREHRSRKRLGYHVFMAHHLSWFQGLPPHIQQYTVATKLQINLFPDDSSMDSTNSALIIHVEHKFAMKLGSSDWRILPLHLKEAWRERAACLNSNKLPGKVVNIPRVLVNSREKCFQDYVMDSLTFEWQKIVRLIQGSIKRKPKNDLSQRSYMFGRERVQINAQAYLLFDITYLLSTSLLGYNFKK